MPYIKNILSKNDPTPVSIINKSGNIIFSGPHNGKSVPKCLKPYMGMEEQWFNNAHDAMDLHIDQLFNAIDNRFDDASLIWGNYSRLVCDLNALPSYSIRLNSSENSDMKIPENARDRCCPKQCANRIKEIYEPYHNAKKQLINEKQTEHGGIIALDLHSFTPTWDQVRRNVELGTIRCEKTPLSRAFEEYLREKQTDFIFVSGEPYRVADRKSNAAPLITKHNNIQYLGLEIRNDLIADNDGIEKVTSLLKEAINYIQNHTHLKDEVIKPRSDILPELKEIVPEIYQGYDI